MRDYLSVTVGCLLALAAFVVTLLGVSWHGDHVACLRLSEQTGYATRMTGTMFGGGCYVNVDGRWIPHERYRIIDDQPEG